VRLSQCTTPMQSIKVVVVGDGAVGKSTFLMSLTLGMPINATDYVPTTFDNFHCVYPFESRSISLGLWDTAGQSDFEKLRPISYKEADVFLLFFSVVNPTSAENIKDKWIAEVKQHCPNIPYFLIGTQTDQRENQKVLDELNERKQKPLKEKDGKKLAKDIEAVKYMECSAKTMSGYRDIFDEVLRFVINDHKQGKKPGKQCWSIDCRQKLAQLSKVRCQGRCGHFYCAECMEYWDDGSKFCPQCVVYEKEERQKKGKKEPTVRKERKPPAERIAEKEEKERKIAEKKQKKLAKSGKPEITEGGPAENGGDHVVEAAGTADPEKEEKKVKVEKSEDTSEEKEETEDKESEKEKEDNEENS